MATATHTTDSAVRFVDADFSTLITPYNGQKIIQDTVVYQDPHSKVGDACAHDFECCPLDAIYADIKNLHDFAQANHDWWEWIHVDPHSHEESTKYATIGEIAQVYWLLTYVIGSVEHQLNYLIDNVIEEPELYVDGTKDNKALNKIYAILPHFKESMLECQRLHSKKEFVAHYVVDGYGEG